MSSPRKRGPHTPEVVPAQAGTLSALEVIPALNLVIPAQAGILQRHKSPESWLRPEASDDSPRDGPVGLRLPEKARILRGTALRDVPVAFRLGRCVGPPRPCGPTP